LQVPHQQVVRREAFTDLIPQNRSGGRNGGIIASTLGSQRMLRGHGGRQKQKEQEDEHRQSWSKVSGRMVLKSGRRDAQPDKIDHPSPLGTKRPRYPYGYF